MSGGGDPNNAMAGAPTGAQAFGYDQNIAPSAGGGQPLWMQGLMGALTGSQKYGQNAPQIHQAVMPLLQGLGKPQQPAPMMGAHMRPQIGMPTAFPGLAPQQPQTQPFGQPPWMGGM